MIGHYARIRATLAEDARRRRAAAAPAVDPAAVQAHTDQVSNRYAAGHPAPAHDEAPGFVQRIRAAVDRARA